MDVNLSRGVALSGRVLQDWLDGINIFIFRFSDGIIFGQQQSCRVLACHSDPSLPNPKCFRHFVNLSFSIDGSQLDIDGRLLMVPSSSLNPPPSMKGSADPSSFMNVKGEWVRYKDCNILWLPPNRRPGVYAFRDKTLVLGNGSGRVTFFQFSSTATPAVLET